MSESAKKCDFCGRRVENPHDPKRGHCTHIDFDGKPGCVDCLLSETGTFRICWGCATREGVTWPPVPTIANDEYALLTMVYGYGARQFLIPRIELCSYEMVYLHMAHGKSSTDLQHDSEENVALETALNYIESLVKEDDEKQENRWKKYEIQRATLGAEKRITHAFYVVYDYN